MPNVLQPYIAAIKTWNSERRTIEHFVEETKGHFYRLIESGVAPLSARLNTHSYRLKVLERDTKEAGPPGPPGPQGDKPAHRWEGTKLSFENPDGSFDEPVDLQGPRGEPGRRGRGAAVVAASAATSSWMPSGW
jgi:hypothetical protein